MVSSNEKLFTPLPRAMLFVRSLLLLLIRFGKDEFLFVSSLRMKTKDKKNRTIFEDESKERMKKRKKQTAMTTAWTKRKQCFAALYSYTHSVSFLLVFVLFSNAMTITTRRRRWRHDKQRPQPIVPAGLFSVLFSVATSSSMMVTTTRFS